MRRTAQKEKISAKCAKKSKAKKVSKTPQKFGWDSTDQEEIDRRRLRGGIEITAIESIEKSQPLFGTFRVTSSSGGVYEIEIRDLNGFTNSCGCADHQVNRLGTCKHIEGVLAALKKRRAAQFRQAAKHGSPRVEVFMNRNGKAVPEIWWPEKCNEGIETVCAWLFDWLGPGGGPLTTDPEKIVRLISEYPEMPALVRRNLRISKHFAPWLARAQNLKTRARARAQFHSDMKAERFNLDIFKATLLPYQKEGMLHLAFGERALLADEMWLGKTIQAIAACELLRLQKGIQRVLVVCPASVKAEWEDQIARFTD